jgi:hypothetical protein
VISEARAVVLGWLEEMWGGRRRAARVADQYRMMVSRHPDALADLACFCCAHDTTYVQGDRDLTLINTGKREVFLHIQNAAGLTSRDLKLLKDRLEGDPDE